MAEIISIYNHDNFIGDDLTLENLELLKDGHFNGHSEQVINYNDHVTPDYYDNDIPF